MMRIAISPRVAGGSGSGLRRSYKVMPWSITNSMSLSIEAKACLDDPGIVVDDRGATIDGTRGSYVIPGQNRTGHECI